ncbi:hypothetical protein XELAEV_18007886mg [Xenopus laevis]|uniref:Uncharacterized protein n=1 Tax=Xenopus laevis TaxID=8355 RepID=A0A974I551_XENLA|nr:hypothetical protein XELAEV_18007886mg [Xenopus laevis]
MQVYSHIQKGDTVAKVVTVKAQIVSPKTEEGAVWGSLGFGKLEPCVVSKDNAGLSGNQKQHNRYCQIHDVTSRLIPYSQYKLFIHVTDVHVFCNYTE